MVHFLQRRCGIVPSHGGRSPHAWYPTAAISWRPKRTGRNCGANCGNTASGWPRSCSAASPAHCAAPRIAWRRAKSWPTIRAWSATTCGSIWRRSFSGAACRSTASTSGPGGGPGRSANAPSRRTATACWKAAPCSPERRRVAVLSPYFPFPLSHGGAVRIFHLLRETAREFDVELFAFTDGDEEPETAPVLEFCARVVLVRKPPIPRAALVHRSAARSSRVSLARHATRPSPRSAPRSASSRCKWNTPTSAAYGGDILVEHDVTFDLFGQIARRERTLAAWWDFFRWRRYETRAVRRYRRVVVMSPKDAALLGPAVPRPR